MSKTPLTVSAATQSAWENYNQAREDVRTQVLSNELCRDPKIRAQALYFLQMNEASAFGFYIAPREAYPHLYVHSIFMPFEITTGQACPDFLYRWAFLDGAHTYRLWGKRGDTLWTDMQVQTGHWGDENVRNLGNYRFDDLQHDADGNYEIVLSSQRHDGTTARRHDGTTARRHDGTTARRQLDRTRSCLAQQYAADTRSELRLGRRYASHDVYRSARSHPDRSRHTRRGRYESTVDRS